jgi:hypothetical protein
VRWAGNVARIGEVLVGKQEERNYLEDPNVNGRIILRWIFWDWDGFID